MKIAIITDTHYGARKGSKHLHEYFEKFYKAEEYHQDFYKIKFERYLRYKKACGREELLKRIWSQ